jgi:CheY-like chemotaxis protein
MTFAPVILCVDDDEDDLLFIREAINSQPHSFTIIEAKDGSEALQFLNKSLGEGTLPCLVIMDMNMPKMNGKQTIHKIRENEYMSKIPIAIFTTSSNESDRRFFEDKGIHFITKPFEYKIFTQEIIAVLALCANLSS